MSTQLNNNNLDDYIIKAKNDDAIISQFESRQLIDNAELLPYKKMSTNYRKNIMKLIATTAAAAIFAGVFAVNNSNIINNLSENKNNKIIVSNSIVSNSPSDKKDTDKLLPKNKKELEIESAPIKVVIKKVVVETADIKKDDNSGRDKKKDKNNFNIQSANVIELTKNELNKLGIKVMPNESIEFTALQDSKYPRNITLSKNGTSIERSNDDKKTPEPKFVTDRNGNKIISLFSGKNRNALLANVTTQDGTLPIATISDKNPNVSVKTMSIDYNSKENSLLNIDGKAEYDENKLKLKEGTALIYSDSKDSIDVDQINNKSQNANKIVKRKNILRKPQITAVIIDANKSNDKQTQETDLQKQINSSLNAYTNDSSMHTMLQQIYKCKPDKKTNKIEVAIATVKNKIKKDIAVSTQFENDELGIGAVMDMDTNKINLAYSFDSDKLNNFIGKYIKDFDISKITALMEKNENKTFDEKSLAKMMNDSAFKNMIKNIYGYDNMNQYKKDMNDLIKNNKFKIKVKNNIVINDEGKVVNSDEDINDEKSLESDDNEDINIRHLDNEKEYDHKIDTMRDGKYSFPIDTLEPKDIVELNSSQLAKINKVIKNITVNVDKQTFKNDSDLEQKKKIIITKTEFKHINQDTSGIPQFDGIKDMQWASKDFDEMPAFGSSIFNKEEELKCLEEYQDINKLIPISIKLEDDEVNYILWYEPTIDLINSLPSKYAKMLSIEYNASKSGETCGNTPNAAPLMDVWKACDGDVKNLGVAPNPAKEKVTISFELLVAKNISISLNDLTGMHIADLRSNVYTEKGNHSEQITLPNNLTAGMYYIVLKSEQGETAIQRLIIQ